MHGDVGEPADLAGEVFDVSARAAIDLGRVLAGEDRDFVSYVGDCCIMPGTTWTFKPVPARKASMALE